MKLYHFTLIFVLVASVFLIINLVNVRLYKEAITEKEYLQRGLSHAADDAMMHFVESEVGQGLKLNKERVINDFFTSWYRYMDIDDPSRKAELEFYFPALCVVLNDGFYIYHTNEYKNKDNRHYYKKIWSEKYYFIHEDNDFIYKFTLSDLVTIYDKNAILSPEDDQKEFVQKVKDFILLDKFSGFRQARGDSFLLNEESFYEAKKAIIISSLEDKLEEYFNKHNEISKKLGISYVFHLPPISNSDWLKAIEYPSLIVLFQAYPLSSKGSTTFNQYFISSSQVKKRMKYIAEEKEGRLICHKDNCYLLTSEGVKTNRKAFYSVKEAAENGSYICKECFQ